VVCDTAGKITGAKGDLEVLVGLTVEEVNGKPWDVAKTAAAGGKVHAEGSGIALSKGSIRVGPQHPKFKSVESVRSVYRLSDGGLMCDIKPQKGFAHPWTTGTVDDVYEHFKARGDTYQFGSVKVVPYEDLPIAASRPEDWAPEPLFEKRRPSASTAADSCEEGFQPVVP